MYRRTTLSSKSQRAALRGSLLMAYTRVDIHMCDREAVNNMCDREAVNNMCDREAVNARSGKRQFPGIPCGLDHVHQLIEDLGEFARLQRGRPGTFLAVQYGRQP
jgi:hypothetical protein